MFRLVMRVVEVSGLVITSVLTGNLLVCFLIHSQESMTTRKGRNSLLYNACSCTYIMSPPLWKSLLETWLSLHVGYGFLPGLLHLLRSAVRSQMAESLTGNQTRLIGFIFRCGFILSIVIFSLYSTGVGRLGSILDFEGYTVYVAILGSAFMVWKQP